MYLTSVVFPDPKSPSIAKIRLSCNLNNSEETNDNFLKLDISKSFIISLVLKSQLGLSSHQVTHLHADKYLYNDVHNDCNYLDIQNIYKELQKCRTN